MVKDHLLHLLVYFLRWRGKESGEGGGGGGGEEERGENSYLFLQSYSLVESVPPFL